jgi:hypothetical protein
MTQHAVSRGSAPLVRRTAQRADHPLAADAEETRPSPHVSLLVATALGFAYTSAAPLETHIRALGSLAEPVPEALEQARTTVLEVEVATPQVRADAAELLHRAAREVSDVLDLSFEPSVHGTAFGHRPAGVPVT